MGLPTLIPLTGAPGQLLWCWCGEGSTVPSCPCYSCRAGCSPEQGHLLRGYARQMALHLLRWTRHSAPFHPRTRQGPHIRASVLLTCLGSSFHVAKAGPFLVIACFQAEACTHFSTCKAVIPADLRAAPRVWQERLLLHRSVE